MPEVLLVKNMVCRRCILAVEDVLIRSAIPVNKVITGEIHLPEKISQKETEKLSASLASMDLS